MWFKFNCFREWSLLIPGTRAEGISQGYQNLWLYFYQATKTFCHKSLKVWGTKTCTYDKQKLTKKSKTIDRTMNYCNSYFIHIYYEFTTKLFIWCTHTHTHRHTYAHIWNQFIQFGITLLTGFLTQFQEIMVNYQNSTNINSMDQSFM